MPLNEAYIQSKIKVAQRQKQVTNRPGTERLPAGQTLAKGFPVLDLGIHPDFDAKTYRLTINGLVGQPLELSLEELLDLPKTEMTADFHCVTRWSKFDVKWGGVLWQDLMAVAKPKDGWQHVMQHALDGYTTNVAREEIDRPETLIAYELFGKPLPTEHGAPVRIIIPQLYAWKGAKFLSGIEFLAEDKPGFWEERGYHNRGDAFLEERYSNGPVEDSGIGNTSWEPEI